MLLFGLLMTAYAFMGWERLPCFDRQFADHQSLVLVLNDIWEYSGLIIVLAVDRRDRCNCD